MSNSITFTEDELENLKDLQSQYQTVIYQWGQLQVEHKLLNDKKLEIESIYDSLRQREKEIMDSLNSKYGDGTLDLDSGTFTPNI